MITLANRLKIPQDTQALLWDMDGVLIDSLGLDLRICNQLLQEQIRSDIQLPRGYIQSIFAYDVPTFWRMILEKVGQDYAILGALDHYPTLLAAYEKKRQAEPFPINTGVIEILQAVKAKGLKQAVVSNNPQSAIVEILSNVGMAKTYFDAIVGNDQPGLKKKPAPDTYLAAAKLLGILPVQCAVIEDTPLGIAAGKAAGAYVIAVATGGATLEELKKSPADQVYQSF